MPYKNALLSTYVTTLHESVLPVDQKLYANIRAFNKAGLYSECSSDVFIVDITPPVNILPPEIYDSHFPSGVSKSTFFDVSIVNIKWKFEDNESSIVKQRLYLQSHQSNHIPFEPITITNNNQITLSFTEKNWLTSGDKYKVVVTACNGADLCTTVVSKEFTYDSTPPHLGHLQEPLSWSIYDSEYIVNITWSGFMDVESGINKYYITVGETYSGQELSGNIKVLKHIGSPYAEQNTSISLVKPLEVDRMAILSIWAVNGVGLLSNISKITTKILSDDHKQNSGILEIERHSCFTHYCNYDCTCSMIGKKCMDKNITNECLELHDITIDFNLNVSIGLIDEMKYTSSSACLSSHWNIDNSSLLDRYEWSLGQLDMPYGDGIFDILHEKVWHDIGQRSSIIHCLRKGNSLLHNQKYVAYVRVWFSNHQFKIYQSKPVIVDHTPPSVRRGGSIKISDETCEHNHHFQTKPDAVTACWNKVFVDSQTGLKTFRVALGTSPGGKYYDYFRVN